MVNIVFFVSDGLTEYNSSRWRASSFYNALNNNGNSNAKVRLGYAQSWMNQDDIAEKLCNWADVISIQRIGIDKTIDLAKKWRAKGKSVVIDYDDDYFRINKSNAAYKFWGNGKVDFTMQDGYKFETTMKVHPITQFVSGLQSVSGVTMPSRLLAQDAKRFTPCSWFLPNYIEKRLYPVFNDKNSGDEIVIGWGGSLSHIESFEYSGIIPALKNVIQDNIYLLIVGDDRVVKKLKEKGVSSKNIRFHPYVPYDRWWKTLLFYDIGIAPLAQEYDMRRSYIKVAEYMAMGIPFVATDGAPYREDFIQECEYGTFVGQGDPDKGDRQSPIEWEKALKFTIENHKERKELARKNRKKYYDILDINNNDNIKSIVKIFEEINESV